MAPHLRKPIRRRFENGDYYQIVDRDGTRSRNGRMVWDDGSGTKDLGNMRKCTILATIIGLRAGWTKVISVMMSPVR